MEKLIYYHMETKHKELYVAPTLTAVEVKQEGVICASPDPNYTPWDNENW